LSAEPLDIVMNRPRAARGSVERADEHAGAVTRVYTPGSPVRTPRLLLAGMAAGVRDSRHLAWRLAVRDITAQYRQTFLGYFWAIAPPLANTLVWALLNRSSFVSIDSGPLPYVVFALTGTIFWQLFVDSLSAPLRQLSANRNLLNRVNFPAESLLLSGGIQVLFSFAIKLLLLTATLIVYSVAVHATAVWVVLPATGLLLSGFALGMVIAPLGLLYRDVDQALPIVVAPLMLLTPVVYTQPSSGLLEPIMAVNPLTPLMNATRALLYGGDVPWLACLLVSLAALTLAAFSWAAYRLAMPLLIERMEA
jgi:lipopolysaccharide transport system permease protein